MLRFCTVGSNFIVEWFRAGAAHCADFQLAGVYSRSAAKAAALAEKWGVERAFSSLDEVAASPHIDAVYIASPNACHAAQIERMLDAGKHVLCEKPAVPRRREFTRLLSLASLRGVALMEAMRPAHLPATALLVEAAERLGPLRGAYFGFCQYSSRYDKFKAGFVENAFRPQMAGGALMDIGIYCVNMMLLMLGEPKEITARGWFLPDSIDAAGNLCAVYENGLQAQLAWSKVNNSFLPCEVRGEAGVLSFSPLPAPRQAHIRWNDGAQEELALAGGEDDMRYEIAAFIEAAQALGRGGGETEALQRSQELTLAALGITDEARRQIGIHFG